MTASLVISMIAFRVIPQRYAAGDPNADAMIMLVTVIGSTIVWVAVTFLTRAEEPAILDSFYKRVRPGGPGWQTVSGRLGFGREPIPGGALAWTNWIAGVAAVYCTLFGIGKLIFGNLAQGLVLMLVAALCFAWIARSFARGGSEQLPPEPEVA